jgi:hypothetical protein
MDTNLFFIVIVFQFLHLSPLLAWEGTLLLEGIRQFPLLLALCTSLDLGGCPVVLICKIDVVASSVPKVTAAYMHGNVCSTHSRISAFNMTLGRQDSVHAAALARWPAGEKAARPFQRRQVVLGPQTPTHTIGVVVLVVIRHWSRLLPSHQKEKLPTSPRV